MADKKSQISVNIQNTAQPQDPSLLNRNNRNNQFARRKMVPIQEQPEQSDISLTKQEPTYSKNKKEKQLKLDFPKNKNKSNQVKSDTQTTSEILSELQIIREQLELEEELKKKDAEIDKIRLEKDAYSKRYHEFSNQHEKSKSESQAFITKIIIENSQQKRLEKAKINPNYGYFFSKPKNFIEGVYLTEIKFKIISREADLKRIEDEKKKVKETNKGNLTFRHEFFKKELNELQEELKMREKVVEAYKDKLSMSEKQQSCTFSKQNWPLISSRYQSLQLLGSGGFGEVYKCLDLEKNEYVALKVIDFNVFNKNLTFQQRENLIKHTEREVETQKKLHHPNIAKFYDKVHSENQHKISFVLEYCSGPELSKYLKTNQCLDQREAKNIIRQVLSALNYLFQCKNKIIHYDLKPANIIFHQGIVKIVDFGLCKIMEADQAQTELTSIGMGTYYYLPPEANANNSQICSKVDIWSVGAIFYELLYGKKLFGEGLSQQEIYKKGIVAKCQKIEFGTSPKRYRISDGVKEFISACLKKNVEERLSPEEAYKHKYFQD